MRDTVQMSDRLPDAGRKYDVFISHARTDTNVAQALAGELSAAGLRVFLAGVSVRPGEDLATEIAVAVADSRAVVALAPRDQSLDASQMKDLHYAQIRGRLGQALLIPVAATARDYRALPPELRQFHGVLLGKPADVRAASDAIVAALRQGQRDPRNQSRQAEQTQDVSYWQEVASDLERWLGPTHTDTIEARGNLADAMYSAGRLPEAVDLYQEVLAQREIGMGREDPRTLTTRANLAAVYRQLGDYEREVVLMQEILADSERVLGPDHPSTLTTRGELAGVYSQLSRYEEASALFQQVLADSERLLGPDHPSTLTTRANLAGVYSQLGRYEEALALFEQVQADSERLLGPDHPSTLTTRANLAGVYSQMGRYDEAIALLGQALTQAERELGARHPLAWRMRDNLAVVLERTGLQP